MAISFNSVPNTLVPFVYVEFDSSQAQQGPSIQKYIGLIIGQRLSTGTKAADTLERITSEAQAREFYGPGSMLQHQVAAWLGANKVNQLNVIALDDDGGGAAAVGSVEPTSVATEDGTLFLRVGGRPYNVSISSADSLTDIADNIKLVIDADTDRHVVTGAVSSDVLPITYNHKGEVGNDIDIRVNHFFGEESPAGLALTIVQPTGGSGNPSIASAITLMAETQYHSIAMAYSDSSNLALMKTELDDRWGPIRQNDGQLYIARNEDFSSHTTYLDTQNLEHETVMNIAGPTPSFMWSSNIAAVVSQNAQIDPARPFQTLSLVSVIAPQESETFNFTERGQILDEGGSTYKVDSGGTVRIERLRTTRIENQFGAPDESLADLNPKLTLSFLRFDFRTNMLLKFPRSKLGADNVRFAVGQAIVTPKIAKAEAVAKFRQWEELALVEDADQFKRDLIVEINSSDKNRLDFLLPPNLINQLRNSSAQIAFRS